MSTESELKAALRNVLVALSYKVQAARKVVERGAEGTEIQTYNRGKLAAYGDVFESVAAVAALLGITPPAHPGAGGRAS